MTSLAVTGYASLDYPVLLDGFVEADRTTLVRHRNVAAWPRLGGCPAYIAAAVADKGLDVSPICRTGSDQAGKTFVDALGAGGINAAGVAQIPASRSPAALLVYQADGSCACLFDAAFHGAETLIGTQKRLIAGARHLCVSVGPPHLMSEILSSRNKDSVVYWVLKNDRDCFTPEICKLLSATAHVAFCNRTERAMIGETHAATVIVETHGTDGVFVEADGSRTMLPVEPIAALDTTGAGDTLAGGFIAAHMAGEGDPLNAARIGLDAVRTLLSERGQGAGP